MDDELYVSTLKQKARGILDVYLNDPSLTAEDEALRSFAELGERQFYPKVGGVPRRTRWHDFVPHSIGYCDGV